jgi:hypothetical protein
MNATATKTVRFHVATVGQHFGCCAQLKARNGRVVWESRVLPLGFDGTARDLANAAAAERGWRIA